MPPCSVHPYCVGGWPSIPASTSAIPITCLGTSPKLGCICQQCPSLPVRTIPLHTRTCMPMCMLFECPSLSPLSMQPLPGESCCSTFVVILSTHKPRQSLETAQMPWALLSGACVQPPDLGMTSKKTMHNTKVDHTLGYEINVNSLYIQRAVLG